MKAIITFILVFLTASLVSAQRENVLINRIDEQSTQSVVRIIHQVQNAKTYFNVCLDQRVKVAQPAGAQEKTFDITMSQPRIEMGLNGYGSVTGHMKNLTLDPVKLIFKRVQVIPAGWTTSVCFGDLCYPDFIDTIPPTSAYILEANAEAEFKLNVTSAPDIEDSVVTYVCVSAVGSSEDDSVGLWMVAVSKAQKAVDRVSGSSRTSIRSVFPSPLVSGNSINVNVEAAREVGYRYSIYDQFAREVAFGTSHRKLMSGNNNFNISSLEGLASGTYLLKLNFTDGSSDTYSFTVLR